MATENLGLDPGDAAATPHDTAWTARVQRSSFGHSAGGVAVDLYSLSNRNGAAVGITNYGARVVSLYVPDRAGTLDDVALGYDDLAAYESDAFFMGAIVGRYGNRIAHGWFVVDGETQVLAQNDNGHHLHGGGRGFDHAVWTGAGSVVDGGARLELSYLSEAGEEGYPGNLAITAVYTWTDRNELKIEYRAETDRTTVLNPTNHTYFDLAGGRAGDILGHELQIDAARFTPVDECLIPTGELRGVRGTPFDFTRPAAIGKRIDERDGQLLFGSGYDHNFVLDKPAGAMGFAAEVYEPISGRVLRVNTTEPGLQFYSGNFLSGVAGKRGRVYSPRSGFCLEAQHFPDAPNRPEFPSTVLRPGEVYTQTTIYGFSTR